MSATVVLHLSSHPFRWSHDLKRFPTRALSWTYFTPDSGLPFRLRSIGPVGPGAKAIVAGKVDVSGMKDHRRAGVLRHDRLRVVDDDGLRYATEVVKRLFVPCEHRVEPLVREGLREEPAREA